MRFDRPGYGDLIAMLAAGRTSIVTDPAFERSFYKLAGFRFLGKRAVRIDILERLSDLIRPALQWNPGRGPRPDGGYDGRRFTTTPAMLSILGATQDDIEEILKGLGYRADVVPPEEAAAHIAALDAADPADGRRSGRPGRREEGARRTPAAATASAASAEPEAALRRLNRAGGGMRRPADRTGGGTRWPDESAQPEAGACTRKSGDGGCRRFGRGRSRLSRPRRPRTAARRRRRTRAAKRPRSSRDARRAAEAAGAGGAEAGPALATARRAATRRRAQQPARPRQRQRPRAAAGQGPVQGQGRRQAGRARPARRPERAPPRHGAGGKSGRPQRKEKPIDPDSPFAKLAALKEQMKK